MTDDDTMTDDDRRAVWLAARREGIGGSDAAAIVGLDPYRSALELYLDKLGELPADDVGEAAAWGNRLEAVVAEHFADETGLDVLPGVPMQWSELYPFAFANVDRLVREPGAEHVHALLEVKTTGAHLAEKWEQGPPDRVQIQVQHYLAVLDLRLAYVAVLIGGQQFQVFEIERDDDLVAALLELERTFWENVQSRTPPAPDSSESATKALARLYADADPESQVELDDDGAALVEQYRNLNATVADLEREKRRIANVLKSLLGDHVVGLVDGRKAVTWSRFTVASIDRAGLELEYPAIAAKYRRDEPRDRLTVAKAQ